MILVTGGTGLVGAHLLYHLSKTNSNVVAIYRDKKNQKHTKEIFDLYGNSSYYQRIIWKKADITDIPSLKIAFDGITHVYHAAAKVSFDSRDRELLRKVNIEGTANIVNLCIYYNIKKLCYVSSIATLSKQPGKKLINEDCDWNPEDSSSDYSISKYGAEMEVWRASQEGVPVVIVNPGVIFGFGLWHTNASKLFKKIKKGMPFYTLGTVGVVAVKDVCNAMISLMDSEITNQRFVLVESTINYQTIFTTIANYLGVAPPKLHVPKWILEISWRASSLIRLLSFGTILGINKYSARAAYKKRYYDGNTIKKSVSNFRYTPFSVVIAEITSKLS